MIKYHLRPHAHTIAKCVNYAGGLILKCSLTTLHIIEHVSLDMHGSDK